MKFLFKAKRAYIGEIRQRKSGKWRKDEAMHWSLLAEFVKENAKKEGHAPHSNVVKRRIEHAFKLIKHLKRHPQPRSIPAANKFMDENNQDIIAHTDYKHYKKKVIQAVHDYIDYKEGKKEAKNPLAKKVESWKEKLEAGTANLKTDLERDDWVIEQFKKSGKDVSVILRSAREVLKHQRLEQVRPGGFAGMCKSVILGLYEKGPTNLSEKTLATFNKAFKTVRMRQKREGSHVIPLAQALSNPPAQYKGKEKLYNYCCKRLALNNDGMVNMAALSNYFRNAENKYGNKPPAFDYDRKPKKLKKSEFRFTFSMSQHGRLGGVL